VVLPVVLIRWVPQCPAALGAEAPTAHLAQSLWSGMDLPPSRLSLEHLSPEGRFDPLQQLRTPRLHGRG